MPRATKLLPCEIPGWPDPARDTSDTVPKHLRASGVLLAHWIRQVNEALAEDKLTQSDLAKLSGVGLRTVSRVLRGGAWPELPTIVAMSSAARVPLPGEGDPVPVEPLASWPDCWQCGEALGAEHPTPDMIHRVEPQTVFEVVTRVHGAAWSGIRCEWIEELLDAGCVPGAPPIYSTRWPADAGGSPPYELDLSWAAG